MYLNYIIFFLIIGQAYGAPYPWGSASNIPVACRSCTNNAYETCGGGVASINQMVSCICTGRVPTILETCLRSACPGDELQTIDQTRQDYCTRYTTTGSWTTGAPTSSVRTGAQSPIITTTNTPGYAKEKDIPWGGALVAIGGVVMLGL
jgi:hypothetical protein